MKRRKEKRPAGMLAPVLAALLLAGCALPVGEGSSQPESAAPPQETQGPAGPETAPPAGNTPEEAPDTETPAAPALDYDELRPIARYGSTPTTICEGYFTMSKDGKWGLMTAEGSELLPCLASEPVASCGWHWIWWASEEGYNDAETYERGSAALQAAGAGELCPGHGGSTEFFFYDLDCPGVQYALDLSALRAYVGSDGPGSIQPVSEEQWEKYGSPLPVFSAHEEGEPGDPAYPGQPVKEENGGTYWYMERGGAGFYLPDVCMANWFFDQALAPVQTNGGLWAYVDRQGKFVTETVYSATYDSAVDPQTYQKNGEPRYAAYLQNGYAAVCRDGGWGLLDSTGQECVPCAYDGAAWEGTALWVKENGRWTQMAL